MVESRIKKIKKRDGRIVDFDQERITTAIFKAAEAVGGHDRDLAQYLSDIVLRELDAKFDSARTPTVEEVQDAVEKVLIDQGHARTAKAYILYRQHRSELREFKKTIIGVDDDLKLNINALKVLESRYLKRDISRDIIETPKGMFRRVAHNIAQAELMYGKNEADVKVVEEKFYSMMTELDFLPNSPTLMNAGQEIQQLSACFVLPVIDSMDGIFDAIKYAAIVQKSGGGTGFSFSRLRQKGDVVKSTSGVASGPISFMKVFNAATDVIKQGGRRRGANMAVLRVDHPDILEFIVCKEKNDSLTNFNISVGLTEKFMKAVEDGSDYELYNPRSSTPVGKLNASKVFDLIVTMAWKNGEPGMIFLDRLNKDNPTPKIGEIECTNPCGEQPLLPFEACNLGSINLARMVKKHYDGRVEVDWEKLRTTVRDAIHFLDNVVDMSKFPLDKIADMVRANRKIGLGVMGFSDFLVQLNIPYDSDDAVATADDVMKFINEESKKASSKIAEERGVFPNWENSVYAEQGIKMRNATVNTIAPTGSISIIAGCSSGIEPLFAICFIRNVLDGTELFETNQFFESIAKERGFYSEYLMRLIAKHGTVQALEEIPADVRRLFPIAHEIEPEWHIRIQAAFQKHVDNAVSKTINFKNSATSEDVERAYMLAYKLGCKGVTIYRDKSRDEQVLNIGSVDTKKTEAQKQEKAANAETVAALNKVASSQAAAGMHQTQNIESKTLPAKPLEKTASFSSGVPAEYSGGCVKCQI
ncbi:vitamin B12-dependent ribonucleotide reductase [Candidatus Micrarchaeota archaeon]|nr:vitamin B12-dependent ribonucleotide reductase [Candidatus Micrarchaeota archaeon]